MNRARRAFQDLQTGQAGHRVAPPLLDRRRHGAHAISIKGSGAGTWDLDMYFYNSSCQLLGQIATAAPDETGVIPSNAKFVLTHLFLGAAVPVTLTITDTQHRP